MEQHSILLGRAQGRAPQTTTSHEGGRVFVADPLVHLRRFLILGATTTFYTSAYDVTRAADQTIRMLIAERPRDVLDQVLAVSRDRLALRSDPTLYVLALLTQSPELDVKRDAVDAVSEVCRTGTDLLHWLAYRYAGRTSNRSFRRAIQGWFTRRTVAQLALQAVKYDQRDGWSLRDALRLGKPVAPTPEHGALFDWIAHPDKRATFDTSVFTDADARRLLDGYRTLRTDDLLVDDAARVIRESRLPRESVPGPLLEHRDVWVSLVHDLPGRALLRNLGKLASLGVFRDNAMRDLVIGKIRSATKVCHPFEFLIARSVFERGKGVRGSLVWDVDAAVSQALAEGFGLAFGALDIYPEPRPLVGLDVSGSMTWANAGGTVLTCVDAETALALVLAYQFPNARFLAYAHTDYPLQVHGRSYEDVRADIARVQGGGTDCAIPIRFAAADASVTSVVSITDSETAANGYELGRLRDIQVRRPDFRHAVVGLAVNEISIADPTDPRQLDFVGLDASLPRMLALFLAGEL